MPSLYLRNVPVEVVERLTRLAERERTSVSAVAIRELADVSRRVDNPALLAALPDTGVGLDEIVDAVDAGRAERWSSSMPRPPSQPCSAMDRPGRARPANSCTRRT